ncbi:hypothetical protein CT0861_10109 [Colletotrichum tofieldiae]|uniref:Chromo domain-containing protein n=1 Tax=Colletotrichum tofieldiae TaxID=708197 RepID=A0A166QFJ8_9PEZI|nr:hypothetical protein CT0861_10109 [Colletotrichum tofieldiae]
MEQNQANDKSAPPSKQKYLEQQYLVNKILKFRRVTSNEGNDDEVEVELLVKWGGEYINEKPTWESDADLCETCREAVLAF